MTLYGWLSVYLGVGALWNMVAVVALVRRAQVPKLGGFGLIPQAVLSIVAWPIEVMLAVAVKIGTRLRKRDMEKGIYRRRRDPK